MKIVKALIGGILGLTVGAVLGFVGIAWWIIARSPSPPPGYAVGWDPISLIHVPMFCATVLFCAVAFAYLFGYLVSRIGRSKRPSQV
jgi:hypothetical protein